MSDAAAVLALQEADFKLLQLRKRLEELPHPQQILSIRTKTAEIKGKADKVAQMQAEAHKALTLLGNEQEISERKLSEAQDKLNAGTAYKETAALSAEIDSLAKRISKLEDDELVQMEKLEKAEAVAAQVKEALEKLISQEQQVTEDYQKQGGALNAAIAHEQKQREDMLASLPPALAQRYEKALQAKGAVAAAHLDKDHCSACHVSLSAGQILKLKGEAAQAQDGEAICECPHCHRLLVVTA